jgi:hypothetical protein
MPGDGRRRACRISLHHQPDSTKCGASKIENKGGKKVPLIQGGAMSNRKADMLLFKCLRRNGNGVNLCDLGC